MQRWFLSLLGTSLSTGALIAVFCALRPLLLRRYTGRMRRLVWLILALRLLVVLPSAAPAALSVELPAAAVQPVFPAQTVQLPATDAPAVGPSVENAAPAVENTVENVTFAASVSGGMLKDKGTRNVGGFIGTVQGSATQATNHIVLSGNEFTNVNLYVNSDYDWSRTGRIIGGLRGYSFAFNITIDGVEYVMTYNDSHAYFTVGGYEINLTNCENIIAEENFEGYQAMQDEVMPYLNGEIIL